MHLCAQCLRHVDYAQDNLSLVVLEMFSRHSFFGEQILAGLTLRHLPGIRFPSG